MNSNFYDTSGSTYSKQRMMSMTNQTEMENFAKSLIDLNFFNERKYIDKKASDAQERREEKNEDESEETRSIAPSEIQPV